MRAARPVGGVPSGRRALPLPTLAAALLAVLTCWDARHSLQELHQVADPSATRPTRAPSLRHLGGERVHILAAHLFGREPAVSEGPSVVEAMHLKLSGTISLADPARGAAIISGADGNSHLVHAGEPLPGGAMLQAVYTDRVVLQGLDGEQVLRLPKPQPGAAGGLLESGSGEEVADASAHADADNGQDPFAPPPLPTPGAVLRSLNLRPMTRNGDPIGMRIGGDAASAAALAKIGLRPGDVLVSVNGEPAQGGSAGAIMRAVSAGETATLAVEHDGAMINVDVGTEQADAMANAYREQASPQ